MAGGRAGASRAANTLRLVAGLEKPDSGRVSIDGRDVTAAAPALRDVTFVFQQYSLCPHRSVYDNLAFPLRSLLRKTSEAGIRTNVQCRLCAGYARIGLREAAWRVQVPGFKPISPGSDKVSAKYLPLYVNEFEFRYNNRMNEDIFGIAIRAC